MPLDLEKLRKLIGEERGAIARIARAAGMHAPNLSRILSGKKPDVPVSTVDRLAAAFGISGKDLMR